MSACQRTRVGPAAFVAVALAASTAGAGQVPLRMEPEADAELTTISTTISTTTQTIVHTIAHTIVQTHVSTSTSTTVSTNTPTVQTITQTIISTSIDSLIDSLIDTMISTLISTSVSTLSSMSDGLSRAAQDCLNDMNKNFAKVARAQRRAIGKCIKNRSKNRLAGESIEACFDADRSGKVAKARAKTKRIARARCAEMPDFGPMDPNAINRAAVSSELSLIYEFLDPDLDSAIIPASDRRGSKCQQSVIKAAGKCHQAKLDEFNRCKKAGMQGRVDLPGAHLPFADQNDIGHCMGYDPRGKVASECDPQSGRVRRTIGKHCSASSLSGVFPGCDASHANELARCMHKLVECRVCRALNDADGLFRDCDELDDGQLNGSCP